LERVDLLEQSSNVVNTGTSENVAETAKPAGRFKALALEVGLALLITLFFGRTVVLEMFTKIPVDGSDIYENLWNYWQWQHNLFGRMVNPYFTDYIYYPAGISLYLHSFQPLVSLQGVLFRVIFGQEIAINLIILLALTLSTWSSYRLFLYVSGHRFGAWIGTLIFVWCNPWLWDFFKSGQVNLISQQWIPLYIICLLHTLDGRAKGRMQLVWPGLAILCLLACSLTEWYYTLQLIILTIVTTLFYLVRRSQDWRERVFTFGKSAVIGFTWLILISPLLFSMLSQASNRQWLVPSQSQTVLRSVDIFSFLLPNGHNFFYGGLAQHLPTPLYHAYNPSGVEGSFNPGYLPLGLALVALVYGFRTRHIKVGLWLTLAIVYAFFALGPVLHVNGLTLDAVKLPYWFLYNLPGLNISRDPSNFSVSYILAIAALASMGTKVVMDWAAARWKAPLTLAKRPVARANLLGLAMVVIIVAEFAPITVHMDIIPVPEFYRTTLAADKAEYAILEVPSHVQDGGLEHERMYYQTFHQKKLLGGQIARDHKRLGPTDFLSHSPFFPEALVNNTATLPTTTDFLTRPEFPAMSPAFFNYFNIRYIVVYPGAIDPGEKEAAQTFLKRALGDNPVPVYQDNTIVAYKTPALTTPLPTLVTDVGQGWFKPDTKDGQTWRWGQFGQSAEIYLVNMTDKPLKVKATFKAFSYATSRTLRFTLNYERDFPTLQLPASPPGQPRNEKDFSLDLELNPGNNILTAFTFEQPVIPSVVTKGQDSDGRKLSYGLRDFKVTPVK
jgi:hypothetical protein